jgi:RNA polymerase sigma-70 factor, ECF subfamily
MPQTHETGITRLLADVQGGNQEARSRLASLVYDELHRLAARFMRGERSGHTLQATVLVHEAFMRLVDQSDQSWQNRAHFFAVAAQVMRRLLIDYARSRKTLKRGAGIKVELDDAMIVSEQRCDEWIAVDEALDRLADRDLRLSRIVEMRFFAGLTEQEIGEVLQVSARTVKRDWRVAKAWLAGELAGVKSDDSGPVGTSERSNS